MKLWIIPLFAIGLFAGSATEEPTERQMRTAFEQTLALQVRNALEFVRESGGEEAVETIRASGNDRYELNAFRKVACRPQGGTAEYVCEFSVDVGLVNGPMRQTLSGRFIRRGPAVVFASEV